jgi:predicted DNA binding protein
MFWNLTNVANWSCWSSISSNLVQKLLSSKHENSLILAETIKRHFVKHAYTHKQVHADLRFDQNSQLTTKLNIQRKVLPDNQFLLSCQEIPSTLRNLKVHFCIHKGPLILVLSQMNSSHTVPPYFCKINLNTILPSVWRSLSFRFSY